MNQIVNAFQKIHIDENFSLVVRSDHQIDLMNDISVRDRYFIEDFHESCSERLKVKEQIKFYLKWFESDYSLEEILNTFQLIHIKDKKIKQLTYDEYFLLRLAFSVIQNRPKVMYINPLYKIRTETVNTFMTVIEWINHKKQVVFVMSHIDHAFLMTKIVYREHRNELKKMMLEEDEKIEKNNSREILNAEQEMQANTVEENIVHLTEENESKQQNEKMKTIHEDQSNKLNRQNVFRLSVKVDDKTIFINPEDIDYIEGNDGKTNIYINNESLRGDYTLNELEKKLSIYGFYRCHRSYIINLQKVNEMIKWSKNAYSIRLDTSDKTYVPLSRTKVKEMQEFFNDDMVHFAE